MKVIPTVKSLWNQTPDGLRRVIHTAWQVGAPILFTQLAMARSSQDVKAGFIVAGAAALAAVKAYIVSRL
jgi:hypothetical protein